MFGELTAYQVDNMPFVAIAESSFINQNNGTWRMSVHGAGSAAIDYLT